MKQVKNYVWLILIIALIITGTGAGLLLLSVTQVEPEILNTSVGGVLLDGLTPAEAKVVVADYFNERMKNGRLVVEIDGNPFTILYSDIDVKVDIDNTMEALEKILPGNGLEMFFYDTGEDISLAPVFTYNSGKLKKILKELLSYYEKEPSEESYRIKDGALVITPGNPGVEVNYEYLENELKKLLFSSDGPLRINTGSTEAFIEIPAKAKYDEPFAVIVSDGGVGIDPGLAAAAEGFSQVLQGVVVGNGQEFSLQSVLDFSLFKGDVEKDLLNRIATALYQAALPLDGIKFISRLPAKMPVSYSEPGFEAVIEGEDADLALINETGKALMLFAETKSDVFKIYIVSTEEIRKGTLSAEKRDEVQPSVITIINKSLSPNETRVVSEGVPGFTVYVYRTIDGVVEELYHDKYLPISKTVETGEKPASPSSK